MSARTTTLQTTVRSIRASYRLAADGSGLPARARTALTTTPLDLDGTGSGDFRRPRPLLGTTSSNEYVYRVVGLPGTTVISFDIFCRSTTGAQITVPANIYGENAFYPEANPLATGTITVGPNPAFYTATFAAPVSTNGTFFIGHQADPNIALSDLSVGAFNFAFRRPAAGQPWTIVAPNPAWRVQCTNQPLFPTPDLDLDALPQLGTTYNVTLEGGVASSIAVLISGMSGTGVGGAPLPGAPGCDLFASPDVLEATSVSAFGTAHMPITIPNAGALVGLDAFHQWGVLDVPANSLGVIVSDAGRVRVGP